MIVTFDYNSPRARKSRAARSFPRAIRLLANVMAVLLFAEGIFLAISDETRLIGSVLVAIGILIQLPRIWYDNDLRRLDPILKEGDNLRAEEFLPQEVVSKLKSIDTPLDLWRALDDTWQQRFFCSHYTIDRGVFEHVSTDALVMPAIWNNSYQLSMKYAEGRISVASLMISLMKTVPNYVKILGKVNLDIEELESSISWLHHTDKVIRQRDKPKSFGGLARDWTSGFTPTLNQVARNISADIEASGFIHRDIADHAPTINEMIKFLTSARQNVLLVGEVGVGKTLSVSGFAQKILTSTDIPQSIRYNQIFKVSPTDIISMSEDKSKIESAVNRIVSEAYKSKNTIIFFDDAYGFFDDATGSINISKLLVPIIENSAVPMIFAMTPQEWQTVAAANSALAGVFNYLSVPEMDRDSSMRVLEDQALYIEARHKVLITYQALEQSFDLSSRYINDFAAPGRAISLLENSINHAEGRFITAASVQKTIEVTRGVKVQTATGSEVQELLSLEDEIHKRMINQSRAVKVVADALRRARSGVNNPNKPMGTFLFLGPTGVGKTELSKSVAAVYFGNEDNIVRVDMNEYTQNTDTTRLLDITNSSSLLSNIGRNPFSVVLFDEIEKAHPEVVNVLLQLLDEGIMRDSNNREVSFRDAIVIATSNAGANEIRAHIEAGQEVEQFERQFIDDLIAKNIFKPEFLNRFDETVLFRPLTVTELVQVVDLLIASVNKNLSRQKVSVVLSDDAKVWLANEGYDPRFGARPLRRMVQRTVENAVAKYILQPEFTPGTSLNLTSADLEKEKSQ